MAGKYLGTEVLDVSETPYKDYSRFDWAMYFIEGYGQIDGSHHKDWVMDQVARIYNGVEIEIKVARWDCGLEEYRVNLLEPNNEYNNWVLKMQGYIESDEGLVMPLDEDGEEECYSYDEGIAP